MRHDTTPAVPDALAKLSLAELRALRQRVKPQDRGELAFGQTPRPDAVPLSFNQEGLWFLDQLEELGSAYNVPLVVRLRGALDRPALERALRELVRRHEILRTRFRALDGEGCQVVDPAEAFALEVVELSEVPAPGRAQDVDRLVRERCARHFDLAAEASLHATLVRASANEHVLALVMHHIVTDAWSNAVIERELSALYAAYREGRPSPLTEPEVQYADFALWQRRAVQGELLERQVGYWRRRLAGIPSALELPLDHPRPTVPTFRGSFVELTLPAAAVPPLRALAEAEKTTPFVVLLAAFHAFLSRVSGQNDVVIGSPLSGRTHRRTEDLVGYFVNTLPVRADLSADPTFAELVAQVKRTLLEAYEHQDVPFDKLVAELRPTRELGRHPIYQAVFTLGSTGNGALIFPGLEADLVAAESSTAKFDLSLYLAESNDGIVGGFEYARDVFEPETVERLATHMRTLLEAALADPGTRVSRLPLLSARERALTIESWSAGRAAYPPAACLHETFARQAARTPQAVAVTCEGEHLTYAQLDARANRLAQHLRAHGVGAQAIVGVHLERSLDVVVAILAVLKAGAAYLPLDPSYPLERIAYMLADAKAGLLLTHSGLPAARAAGDGMTVVCLDRDRAAIERRAAEAPRTAARPDQLAYVIYTSGSTGTPKGVMVSHHNVARLFAATAERFAFGPADVWVLFHSYAFDFSVWEMFGALLHGGRVVVAPLATAQSPDAFLDVLIEHKVSVLNQTPSAFRELLRAVEQRGPDVRLPALRAIVFGGEALDVALLGPWFACYGDQRPQVVNMFGITETTVHVTYRRICACDVGVLRSPIGGPIADLCLYVLDANLEPVPAGVPGELYVGGAGLARGYLHRPALTAERFIPDPFARAPGERLYKTGDRAKLRSDGELEYLGRNDYQVKIRGFRIELGEIAARLEQHPGVRAAVVLAREDTPGETRLVAYYTVRPGVEVGPDAVRAHLSAALPQYMVPAASVLLDALPLTENGKLDHVALPAPDASAFASRAYEAPVGPVETALAQIWSELLEVERVGRRDNFFELGGHSLLVLRVLERMRGRGLHADVRALFTAPELAAFAAEVGGESGTVAVPPNLIPPGCTAITPDMLPLVDLSASEVARIVASVPGGAPNVQDVYPLAPLQQGILFHYLLSRGDDPYLVQSFYRFDSRARLDAYLAALQKVIDRHDILRTAILWSGLPEPVQVVWRRAELSVEELPAGAEAGEGIERLRAHFAPQHFRLDLARAPLMHVGIAPAGTGEGWSMTVQFHHLVDDNTSLKMLRREIEAHLLGREAHLPAPLPFRNFVAQTRLGVSAAEHEAFFRELLGDVEEPTTPFGITDVRGSGADTAQASRSLEPALAAGLRARARALGVSAASLFHLAWARVLAEVSGREDVVFGTVLFGRMQGGEGADRVLGLFINTLPIRISCDRRGVEQGVRQTHALLARLLRHEHASLTLAQRCSRVAAPAPLFTALLNYRNNTDAADEPASCAWDGIEVLGDRERTNYPFVLSVDDMGDTFILTAQVLSPLDPMLVCRLVHATLERLLHALTHAPALPIRTLDVLPDAERHQLVTEWNATDRAYPRESCIHELIEARAADTPTATAISHHGAQLSYDQLNVRANRLAHFLRSTGVGPDTRVAVCMEHDLDMVVGMVAALKAGGAYVPLDPAYPADRLAYMLADSAPAVVLTHGTAAPRVRAALGERHEVPVIDLTTDAHLWADAPEANDARGSVTPEHLAYVIYTSGSTGRPKGVMVEHRALYNVLRAMRDEWNLRPADHVLALTTPAFDISTLELFLPLIHGARITLVERAVAGDPLRLASLIDEVRPTLMCATPATWRMLVDSGWHGAPWLKAQCGGEALPVELATQIRKRVGVLMNVYGPTEAAILASTHPIDADTAALALYESIGRPLPNTRLYVLNAHGDPVPVGVDGELYIGGVQVVRGYVNLPALTAERFVPDPFAQRPGARMYKTGDIVRYRPDGEIEFVGRSDFQVKLRGYRIELGEIEAQLAAHPDVGEAVVLAREDAPGEKRLVAYYTSRAREAVLPETLRAHLAAALPDYMVPAAYVALDAMPIAGSGKLDRKALAAPGETAFAAQAYEAPVGPAECALAEIWAEVLGRERVGRRDDFFELGGHSLLAVRLVSRVRESLGAAVDLVDVLGRPVLSDFAAFVALDGVAGAPAVDTSAPAFVTSLRSGAPGARTVCFVPTLLGLGLHYGPLAARLDGEVSVRTCRLPGTARGEQPLDDFDALVSHCVDHLLEGLSPAQVTLVGWSFGGALAFATACRLAERGTPLENLILIDAYDLSARADSLLGDALIDFERFVDPVRSALSAVDQQALAQVFEAGARAFRHYRPGRLEAGVTHEIRAEQTAALLLDPNTAIRPFECAGRTLTVLPGDHFSIFEERALPRLARAVDAAVLAGTPRQGQAPFSAPK
jgi:amino acid adenylation domain-containing protein